MEAQNIFNQIPSALAVWLIVKIFVLFTIGLYIVFATVVVRQVQLMTDTVKASFDPPLRIISWAHLILTILVFLLALATL